MNEQFLTVQEVAQRLRVSTKTIRRQIAAGVIKAVKPLSDRAGWRISVSEFERITFSGQQKKNPAESEDPTG